MNEQDKDKLVQNLKEILRIIVISPIVWFGTFGNNQICMNITIFFTIFVSILFIGFVIAKDKIIEELDPEYFSNDFLHAFCWLIPATLLIASGWILLGCIWFFCWCLRSSYRSEIRKNLEK